MANKRFGTITGGKGILALFKRYDKLILFIVIVIGVILIYATHGTNIWAETVAEYQRYAMGEALTESFAGYITIFPIVIGYVYHMLFSSTSTSWYMFSTMVSCLYVILCISAMAIICKKKNLTWQYMIPYGITLATMLWHPSVRSIINITHLGYLPVISYLLICAFDGSIVDDIGELPVLTLIPLVIAVISKPSLFFLPLFFVLFLTKLYKKQITFGILLLSVVGMIFQIFLFSGGTSGFRIGGLTGIFKFVAVFIETVGAAFIFPIVFYIDGTVSEGIILMSALVGIYIVGSLLFFLWKGRNKYSVWIGIIFTGSVLLSAVLPFIKMDYSTSFLSLAQQALSMAFSKYKLQYQLTSSMVVVLIILFISKRWVEIKTETKRHEVLYGGVSIALSILLLNGLASSIYSSGWQTVRTVGNSKNYKNDNAFMYAPYPDWDFSWSDMVGGWIKGNSYKGYHLKPEVTGGSFRAVNDEPLPEIRVEDAKIYLMLSDPYEIEKNPTYYWDYFYNPNTPAYFTFAEHEIEFSAATPDGIRYAVIDYSAELAMILKSGDFALFKTETEKPEIISPANLEYILVW